MVDASHQGETDSAGSTPASKPLSVAASVASPELAALRGSEALYRFLAENTSDIIARVSLDGVVLYVSPAVRMLGYEPEALLGTSADFLVHPDDLENFEANAAALLTDGPADPTINREHRYRTASGQWVWLEGNPRLVRNAAGAPIEIVNAFRNVTERRALRDQAARQAKLATLGEEVAGVGYWRLEIGSEEVTWSKQAYKIYGLEPEITPSISLLVDLMPPEDRPMARLRFEAAIKQGLDWNRAVTRTLRPDGELRYLEGHGVCERDAKGVVTALFGTVVDITERMRAEEAKAESERRYRRMSDRALLTARAAHIGVWEHDLRTNVLLWDERMFQLYGLTSDTVLTFERFRAAVHPDDREQLTAQFHALLERDVPLETEFRIVQPDGDIKLIRAIGELERNQEGAPLRIVGGNWDVTAVRSLEESLRVSEARARNVITHANLAVVTVDEAGLITGWNRHAQSLFGWKAEEAIGAPLTTLLIPSRDRDAYRAGTALLVAASEGDVADHRSEIMALRKDGTELPVELAISAVRGPVGLEVTALMHDISERKAQLELFENAFQHAAIGKTLVGLDGAFLKVNPALCALVGYSEPELLALDFQAITHPDDLHADLDLLRQLTEGSISTYRMDKRYFRKDGTIVWIHLVVSLVVNPDGSPRHYISQIQDLTARRQAESALKESEARYRLMTQHAGDVITRYDFAGAGRFISPAIEKLLGYTVKETRGLTVPSVLHPGDCERVMAVFAAMSRGLDQSTLQHRSRHKMGHYVWVETNLQLVRDELGAPREIVSVSRDISDRKALELETVDARDAAREQAQRARLAEGIGGVGYWRYDLNTQELDVSPKMFEIYGLERVERPAIASFNDQIHPEERAWTMARIAERLRTGEADYNVTTRIVRLDGEERSISGSSIIEMGPDETPSFIMGTVRDVTDERRAQADLAASESRYRLMADSASDMITSFGPGGDIRFISPACRSIMGFTPEEMIGRRVVDMTHPEDVPVMMAHYADLIAKGPAAVSEPYQFRARHKDGHWVWLEGRPKLFFDPETGKMAAIQDVARDITGRKALEAALEQARADAEAAAAVKAEFLSNMSHELRTPLTAVLGFSRLIEDQPELSPATRRFVDRVSNAGKALLSTVNDILDFSKLEAGQVEIVVTPSNPRRVLEDAMDLFSGQAQEKGLDLVMTGLKQLPVGLVLAPDRIRQILLNLIGNAVKFTDSGRVELSAKWTARTRRLRVSITDSGAGIPADRLDQLFKRFSQVDGSSTRQHGGTGLGLAICKGLVDAMGGQIGVFSQLGKGSSFWFDIPADRTSSVSTEAEDAASSIPEGCRVLVVDDNAVNRDLVCAVLRVFGAEMAEAADGEAAVQLSSTRPFDVILMDLRMPGMGGEAAARQIRQDGLNGNVPIIAFSADVGGVLPIDIFDGVVAKPLDARTLIAEINRTLSFEGDIENAP